MMQPLWLHVCYFSNYVKKRKEHPGQKLQTLQPGTRPESLQRWRNDGKQELQAAFVIVIEPVYLSVYNQVRTGTQQLPQETTVTFNVLFHHVFLLIWMYFTTILDIVEHTRCYLVSILSFLSEAHISSLSGQGLHQYSSWTAN